MADRPPTHRATPASGPAFARVTDVPDRTAIERRLLARWAREATFDRLRQATRGGEPFSFVDGPITANNPMGVHHARGRTLKDVLQRYHAMLGHELRWQNGFDCQGLWVEVEVERSLGLDTKAEIEEFGLDRFARACRDRVAEYAAMIAEQSRELGMWMDWDRSYFTMTDPNISAIWRFLATCHDRGWLYLGHRLMPWCARCGTSLSEHELADSYADLTHLSLYVGLPLRERPDEDLVVWTTTPWTLPANVAAAVAPDATYARLRHGDRTSIVAEGRLDALPFTGEVVDTVAGSELVDLTYDAPFADLPVQRGITHRVVAWDGVALDEGTGVVHIAPGCGLEDHELGRAHDLPVLSPIDEAGRFADGYGRLTGLTTDAAAARIADALRDGERLVHAADVTHRYPVCWRCSTPLVHRLVDEWFIDCDPIRERLLDAARTVDWHPPQAGKQMAAWLSGMGDWCISRKRYWGLPLPFWRCAGGHLTVVGSEEELLDRAVSGADGLVELHRPWIDDVVLSCATCGRSARRVEEVGDCWLDAGIVPLSTLGWGNDERVEAGYAEGAGEGLTVADLPDHDHWERWFPADWVCEMREQVRLWFYATLFMSVALDGRAPFRNVLAHGRVTDEDGREMHKSWGNAIRFDDAVAEVGADTMRWAFAAHDPGRDIRFGFGLAEEVERRFLTLWNSYAFLVTYANVAGWRPDATLLERGPDPAGLTGLDRWLLARVDSFVADARETLGRGATPAFTRAAEACWTDLSGWWLRRSRRRAWDATDGGDTTVFSVLWYTLVTLSRCLAPVTPFLAEELWSNLVRRPLPDPHDSVHLAGYPEPSDDGLDEKLLATMAEVRHVAELGRTARERAEIRLRQPLPALLVASHDTRLPDRLGPHVGLLLEECNVAEIRFVDGPQRFTRTEVIPEFSVLGPRYGPDAQEIGARLRAGEAVLDEGAVRLGDRVLRPDEYTLRSRAGEGFAVAEGDGVVVALETAITPELELEGRARDLVRAIQQRRKDLDLEVTERIVVTVPPSVSDVADAHGPWIAAETLTVAIERGDDLHVRPAS